MTKHYIHAAGRMALVLSSATPSWLWEGPAALDNGDKYTLVHIPAFSLRTPAGRCGGA